MLSSFQEMELLKVTGIKYEFKRGAKGVRLVCLKLSAIDPDTSQIQGWNITIKCVQAESAVDNCDVMTDLLSQVSRHRERGRLPGAASGVPQRHAQGLERGRALPVDDRRCVVVRHHPRTPTRARALPRLALPLLPRQVSHVASGCWSFSDVTLLTDGTTARRSG